VSNTGRREAFDSGGQLGYRDGGLPGMVLLGGRPVSVAAPRRCLRNSRSFKGYYDTRCCRARRAMPRGAQRASTFRVTTVPTTSRPRDARRRVSANETESDAGCHAGIRASLANPVVGAVFQKPVLRFSYVATSSLRRCDLALSMHHPGVRRRRVRQGRPSRVSASHDRCELRHRLTLIYDAGRSSHGGHHVVARARRRP
jgi:hypothetical protein